MDVALQNMFVKDQPPLPYNHTLPHPTTAQSYTLADVVAESMIIIIRDGDAYAAG